MHIIPLATSLPVRLLSFALSSTLLVALMAPFDVRIAHAAGAAVAPRMTTTASSPITTTGAFDLVSSGAAERCHRRSS